MKKVKKDKSRNDSNLRHRDSDLYNLLKTFPSRVLDGISICIRRFIYIQVNYVIRTIMHQGFSKKKVQMMLEIYYQRQFSQKKATPSSFLVEHIQYGVDQRDAKFVGNEDLSPLRIR